MEVFTNLARRLVLGQLQGLKHGKLIITDLDDAKYTFGTEDTSSVNVHILDSAAWARLLLANDVGFSEAYMLGQVECSDLTSFFRLFIRNAETPNTMVSDIVAALTGPLYRVANTSTQSLTNAQKHYSLGNDIFEAFLDETMTYSAPLWLPMSSSAAATDNLGAAQHRKLQFTIQAARITTTDHVLEIGTGWGSFAIEAVMTTGCRVTTVTASKEQAVLARSRIKDAGFEDHVDVLVCDYRDIASQKPEPRRYDKIVSIEMVEHVGARYLDTYFKCIDSLLKLDGGIAVVQSITIPEGRAAAYARRSDFIQRYIFPGGHLPTVSGLVESVNRGSEGRLVVDDVTSLGGHYVRALREWRNKFLKNWTARIKPALKREQPDLTEADADVFRRKWEYYFSYCEAGFATKTLGDVCITAAREGTVELLQGIPS